MERDLKPFLIRELKTNEWPGTRITGPNALVRHYKVSRKSIEVLARAGSFRNWRAPDFPEDLAFYRKGELAYFSIAHEDEESFVDEE